MECNTSIHLGLGFILELQLQATKQEKNKANYWIDSSQVVSFLQFWRNLHV